MLYDLVQAPPEPGSLQESVLLIIAKRRQEAQFLQTRVLMRATLAPHVENGVDGLKEDLKALKEAMFPWLEADISREKEYAKKVLDTWTGIGAIKIKPMWRPHDDKTGIVSRLKKGAEVVKREEEMRRSQKYTRLA